MARKRFAVVLDGVVENVVVWDSEDQPDWAPQEGEALPCAAEVAAGWTWADGGFAPPGR